ncbi:Lethal(3)malignant brain tumor-like protein 1 [Chionoecetes opilio]|uniref:Lethal(3)malignant brain tumor-like protein 1 n=1 Tax=Chionoecetes opilio TaxID=41210 RepID=A0A8J4YDV4_CHIOP|nr:Lethal(3)malignant brain tumor-like protein 1 [Chionoecetes opilio]
MLLWPPGGTELALRSRKKDRQSNGKRPRHSQALWHYWRYDRNIPLIITHKDENIPKGSSSGSGEELYNYSLVFVTRQKFHSILSHTNTSKLCKLMAWDVEGAMADQPVPEKPATKVDAKGKEPQKFLYLQLQQDRCVDVRPSHPQTGDGSGRVATLVGGRGGSGPAHFIPLTAKLNSISVLGSGPRASRPTVNVATTRTTVGGRRNSGGAGSPAVVTMATTRPVVGGGVSAVPTRCVALPPTSPRPILASPVTTVAGKTGSAAPIMRKAHTNVMVSSGVARPASSPNTATITVLGGGAASPVVRPNSSQGASSHPPVILHTSTVQPPPPSPTHGTAKAVTQRLLPIPFTQMRTGGNNKAVLSYSALLQAGGGGSGSGGGGTSKKEGQSSPQPLLLQAASPGVKNAVPLAKPGGATISIITGKCVATGSKPVNMVAVNYGGQSKSNMINFKISNGQIQTDNLQAMDVLRETRPIHGGKRGEERKEAAKVVVGTPITHGAGVATGAGVTTGVTVSVTGPMPGSLKIPDPVIVPVTFPLQPSGYETVGGSGVEQESLSHFRDVSVHPARREQEDLLQRAVSTLGNVLEDEDGDEEDPYNLHSFSTPLNFTMESPEDMAEAGSVDREAEAEAMRGRHMLCTSQEPSSPCPIVEDEIKVKVEDGGIEMSPLKNDVSQTFPLDPKDSEEVKEEQIKFSDLLKWEDGVGKLDGSALKFKMNEFNAVEIVEDRDLEELKVQQVKRSEVSTRHHARKPNYRDVVKDEDIFSDNSQDSEPQGNKPSKESYDICCCKNCGCYGLSSEHDARELEWGKERLRQEKERQRRKRLRQTEKLRRDRAMGRRAARRTRKRRRVATNTPGRTSLFCVMTVAEIIGHRLRLHFDGYSEQHDFWVNANSPNIFPAGWCEKNGRQLEPPSGVIGFSWKAYLEHCKAQTAPRQRSGAKPRPPSSHRIISA